MDKQKAWTCRNHMVIPGNHTEAELLLTNYILAKVRSYRVSLPSTKACTSFLKRLTD